jgi:N-acetylmuramic acid 6-phosphate etherase
MNTADMSSLATESANPATADLDQMATLDLVAAINREDAKVAAAVAQALPSIAAVIDRAVDRMRRGGRLIYFGAGTSG